MQHRARHQPFWKKWSKLSRRLFLWNIISVLLLVLQAAIIFAVPYDAPPAVFDAWESILSTFLNILLVNLALFSLPISLHWLVRSFFWDGFTSRPSWLQRFAVISTAISLAAVVMLSVAEKNGFEPIKFCIGQFFGCPPPTIWDDIGEFSFSLPIYMSGVCFLVTLFGGPYWRRCGRWRRFFIISATVAVFAFLLPLSVWDYFALPGMALTTFFGDEFAFSCCGWLCASVWEKAADRKRAKLQKVAFTGIICTLATMILNLGLIGRPAVCPGAACSNPWYSFTGLIFQLASLLMLLLTAWCALARLGLLFQEKKRKKSRAKQP